MFKNVTNAKRDNASKDPWYLIYTAKKEVDMPMIRTHFMSIDILSFHVYVDQSGAHITHQLIYLYKIYLYFTYVSMIPCEEDAVVVLMRA